MKTKGKHYLPPHSASYEILLLPGGDHLYVQKSPVILPEKPKRESTKTILMELASKGFLSRELASRMASKCETNRQLAKTIRRLHEMGLLADILRFFDNDEDRENFLRWLSVRTKIFLDSLKLGILRYAFFKGPKICELKICSKKCINFFKKIM